MPGEIGDGAGDGAARRAGLVGQHGLRDLRRTVLGSAPACGPVPSSGCRTPRGTCGSCRRPAACRGSSSAGCPRRRGGRPAASSWAAACPASRASSSGTCRVLPLTFTVIVSNRRRGGGRGLNFCRGGGHRRKSGQAVLPISRFPARVHDGRDNHGVGQFLIDEPVGNLPTRQALTGAT
jgi:hypothetical protein